MIVADQLFAGDNGASPEDGLHGTMSKLSYFNGVAESLDDVACHIDDLGGPKTHGKPSDR